MHSKTISWNGNEILIFICFVGRLLDPFATSCSSFMTSSFLIQMLKMDKRLFQELSPSYSSSLEGSSLDGESFIFICSYLLFSSYELSFFFFPDSAESNHFLLAHIPQMNESHDPGRPFKVVITTSAFSTFFFFYRFKLFFDLRDPCKVWLYGLFILDLHILQPVSQSNILIYVLPFK